MNESTMRREGISDLRESAMRTVPRKMIAQARHLLVAT
jgi:hypothetical protein